MLTPSAAKHGGSLAGKDSKSAVSITSSRTAAMVTLFGQVRWRGRPRLSRMIGKYPLSQTDPPKNMGAASQFSQDAGRT